MFSLIHYFSLPPGFVLGMQPELEENKVKKILPTKHAHVPANLFISGFHHHSAKELENDRKLFWENASEEFKECAAEEGHGFHPGCNGGVELFYRFRPGEKRV